MKRLLVVSLVFSLFMSVLLTNSPKASANGMDDAYELALGENIIGKLTTKVSDELWFTFNLISKETVNIEAFVGSNDKMNKLHKDNYKITVYNKYGEIVTFSNETKGGEGFTQNISETLSKGKYFLSLTFDENKSKGDQYYELNTSISKSSSTVTGVTLKTTLKSPQSIYSVIELKSTAKGSNLDYQFLIQKNKAKRWDTLQPFSDNSTAYLIPYTAGKYNIKVVVKDRVSKKTSSKTISYTFTKGEVKVKSLKTSVKSPQKVGKKIKLTTKAEGLNLRYTYQVEYKGKKTTLVKSAKSSSYNWSPKKAGSYKIKVTVEDAISMKKDTKTIKYTIKKK